MNIFNIKQYDQLDKRAREYSEKVCVFLRYDKEELETHSKKHHLQGDELQALEKAIEILSEYRGKSTLHLPQEMGEVVYKEFKKTHFKL